MELDEAADGIEVQVNVAHQIKLALRETPTAGYRWNVVSDGSPVTRVERDEYVPPTERMLGASGRHIWEFRADRAGTTQIELVYARPFETNEPVRQFTVRVVVR